MQSIKEVSDKLENDLQRYIEATYHLHHPRLIKERRAVMNDGETSTEPWVEATPTYESGDRFRELNLPTAVVNLLKELEGAELDIFDPPYKHQADALESFFGDDDDLIVSTGTGSGKTEIFLYSILGQLAQEAQRNNTPQQRGIRTLVLYPMNALVADQLSRMRQLFGDKDGADILEDRMDRRVQFGMYTSRTPYHGEFDTDKNDRTVKPIIDRYLELAQEKPDLFDRLDDEGRVPAKDLDGFRNFRAAKETQFRTQSNDTELFTRQEMHDPDNEHGGTPDILITNYSMLEYMLLRPIEQPLFEDTKQWLEADEENELNIVLDEAHLYRGAQGAEVALLLSRLLQTLDISRDRVRFILTSATMGENLQEAAPEFAAQLTTGEPDEFAVIEGSQVKYGEGGVADERTAALLEKIGYQIQDPSKLRNFAAERGWDPLTDDDPDEIRSYLGDQLQSESLFLTAHAELQDEPLPLADLAETLFPTVEDDLAQEATGNLLYLCTEAQTDDGRALLPTRLHMFLKGLPAQYACVNPECGNREVTDEENILGGIYTNPHTTCPDCDSRVFELLSHRSCGAAYLRAYRRPTERGGSTFLWTNPKSSENLEEVHLLVEEPRDDPDPKRDDGRTLKEVTKSQNLDISTGHLVDARYVDDDSDTTHIEVWVPTDEPTDEDKPWSWPRCPACGVEERSFTGDTRIEDLVTKGEEPFANIVRSMFGIQPVDENKLDLPNKGRKVLCFSDGRQKAARLARDLQNNVELDSFREVITEIIDESEGELSLDQLFAEFAVYCKQHNIVFFDDSDERATQQGVEYQGSRSHFEQIQSELEEIKEDLLLESIEEIPDGFADHVPSPPRQYQETLLRALGDEYYSMPALLIGYVRPVADVMEEIQAMVEDIDPDLVESILIEAIWNACEQRAFDKSIEPRRRSNSYSYNRWIDPDEVGLDRSEMIPEYVVDTIDDIISDDDMRSLKRACIKTRLFDRDDEGQGTFLINPEATTIELRLDEHWYRCEGCRRFSVTSLDGRCPHEDCEGNLETVDSDDTHLQSRKGFFREPPRAVLHDERDPLTLRSEEHSAQLSGKDNSEAFARSEKYELLFQDILVGDSEVDQPIDVLSCTTTMEVGIDIGSITGVAMRTVPPGPENYEQRAGRAGRRGTGLSTIVTFADNSPHESHYFENPDKMITSEGNEPIIYAGNEKIARRHLNASLLARYFDPSKVEDTADVFQSLSSTQEFFENEGEQTLGDFEAWVQDNVLVQSSPKLDRLASLLPDALGENRPTGWEKQFVQQTAEEFIVALRDLQQQTNWESEADADDDLLAVLLDAALLPTFSFPTDVCDFIVQANERDENRPKTKYEMSRDLKQALSTYVPGREIVVDKKTYESYGLFFRFAQDPVNRASNEEWGDLEHLNWCPVCETVYEERGEDLEAEGFECPVCEQSTVSSLQMYTPKAFAPEVNQYGSPEVSENSYSEDRVYATDPKYPLTTTTKDATDVETIDDVKAVGHSVVRKLSNEELIVANFGPDEGGFEVCTQCGAVDSSGDLTNPHNRPYPRDARFLGERDWPNQCSGSTVVTSFSHTFRSDLTVLRIPLTEEMRYLPAADWFDTASQSIAEALIMGASRALGIEDTELEGGYRTRSAEYVEDDDVHGLIEIFLFDTTAGGAGFSARVWDQFDAVLDETEKILSNCSCDTACHNCLRRYDNRHLHESLDRHQGYDLLTYAKTGEPPRVGHSKANRLISQLDKSLRLREQDVEVTQASQSDRTWDVSLHGETLKMNVRSALRRSRVHQSPQLDVDYTDYQLEYQLAEVAHDILDRVA